jgi:hypothetical protein
MGNPISSHAQSISISIVFLTRNLVNYDHLATLETNLEKMRTHRDTTVQIVE